MSHTPRRLRPPKPVTVLRWMGETRLDAEAAAAAKRQYLKASQRGIVLTDARWEAYNPAITPARPKPEPATVEYVYRSAEPIHRSLFWVVFWAVWVIAVASAVVALIWTEVAR